MCTCGKWAKYNNIRTKGKTGKIRLNLTNNTSTVTAIRLHDAKRDDRVFTDPRVFTKEPQKKTIAKGVQKRTRFKIGARMYADRFGDNYWAGKLRW